MARRPPSPPPALGGFEHIRLLGSGGFADVFLYQQLHPRRQVAVKVLLKDKLGTASAEGFTDEANLMAQLATHPSIVSVYQAGVSDDGRPYLVMEYCSKPNLQIRHKRERFSEAETLRVGIEVAGAVETAHRAGILHRDIKPANILSTDYGRSALTDFGISATTNSDMSGMSLPWSPPESFKVPAQGDARSDVYSLAATLYTLLTNRSPFEVPGGSNSEIDLIARIQSTPVPALGRHDVSPSLEATLRRAMAKNPGERYASAIEFGRALQKVQIEQGMAVSPIDVLEDEIAAIEEDDDEGRTQFRGITSIDAQRAPSIPAVPPAVSRPHSIDTTAAASNADVGEVVDETIRRAPAPAVAPTPAPAPGFAAAPPVEDTVRPAPVEGASPQADPPAPRRRLGIWIAAAAVLLVVVVVGVALVISPQEEVEAAPERTTSAPVDVIDEDSGPAPTVTDLSGVAGAAGVVFTWTNPDPRDGDTYLWRQEASGETFTYDETSEPTVTIAPHASGNTCIEVVLRRANGTSADTGAVGCAP
ncbi:MAG: serine/threonine protein kinase [Actinobacteria bacterium]|nr:serine/threonine protein kinase [Actinomycetota bacterium]